MFAGLPPQPFPAILKAGKGFSFSRERTADPWASGQERSRQVKANRQLLAVLLTLELTQSESGGAFLYPFACAVDFRLLLPDGTVSESYRAEGQLTVRQWGEETLVHDLIPNDQNLFSSLAQRIGTKHDL